MFDNVLLQEKVVDQLRRDISRENLPASLLFYGEPYSGKLTTALELARVLTCELGTAEWGCSCSSCEKQRLLTHPATVLLGNRYFMQEISACSDVVKRHREPFAQYMFVRSVRKLTRRFDADFSEEGGRAKKGLEQAKKVEAMLEEISPGMDIDDDRRLAGIIDGIVTACKKIAGSFENSSIPIDQIRKAAFWVHTSIEGLNKVVILENVDRTLAGSKNALLKTLEEPPEHVYFILITEGKTSLLPTVLSRVRPYRFRPRDEQGSRKVLKAIFREESEEYSTLKDYFQAWNNIDPVLLKSMAGKIIAFLFAETVSTEETAGIVAEVVETASAKMFARALIEEVLARLREVLRSEVRKYHRRPGELQKIMLWNKLLNDCTVGMEIYNQRPSLLLENLLYSMREV